jgi:hypothetical protein
MSAFDAISQTGDIPDRWTAADSDDAGSHILEAGRFEESFAHVLACFKELKQDTATRPTSPKMNLRHAVPTSVKALALGDALRTAASIALENVLALRCEEALTIVEAIQMVGRHHSYAVLIIQHSYHTIQFLDNVSSKHPFRRGATHLLIKLADQSHQFPRSLYVEDHISLVRDNDSHFMGGFADVYKALRAEELIAVKKPRADKNAHKVSLIENLYRPESNSNTANRDFVEKR